MLTFHLKTIFKRVANFFEEYTLVKVCWATKEAHFDIIMSLIDWVFLA